MTVEAPEDHREVWQDAQPVPPFCVPSGWQENQPMENHNRTQVSLRSEDWKYHIDINAVPRMAEVDGPYWLELRRQIGGEVSFETEPVHRITNVERSEVQRAIYRLTGKARSDRVEGGDA